MKTLLTLSSGKSGVAIGRFDSHKWLDEVFPGLYLNRVRVLSLSELGKVEKIMSVWGKQKGSGFWTECDSF